MNNKGDIEAYIASSILQDKNHKFYILKVDGDYSVKEIRSALLDLEKKGFLKIEQEINPHTYIEPVEYPFEIRDSNSIIPTLSTHSPHSFKLSVTNSKELSKLSKKQNCKEKDKKDFLYRNEKGVIYVKGKELNISENTDHYHLLEMFIDVADNTGYLDNKDIIKFLNQKGIRVQRRGGGKEKINKTNLYKKVSNSRYALIRFSHNRIKGEFIQPVKSVKEVVGWRMKT